METFMKEKGLQESGSPTTEPLSMTDQEWNSPALDKEESATFSETINDDVPIIIDKTDELKSYFQLSVDFNTSDSMGANFINSCLEA